MPIDNGRLSANQMRVPEQPKNPAAVELGRRGGFASAAGRMAKLTQERRSAIARHAALARWKGHTPKRPRIPPKMYTP